MAEPVAATDAASGSPFEDAALRSPPFGPGDAVELAAPWFDDVRAVTELGSQQDRTFLVADADGRRGVLKVANPVFGRPALELQNAAMAHVAGAGLPFATPRALPADDGREIVAVLRDGRSYDVRLVTFIEGSPLVRAGALPRTARADLGRVAALVATALRDFDHPAARRAFQWSVHDAPTVIRALAATVGDPARRSAVTAAAEGYEAAAARFADLRRQVVHGDVTEYNVIARGDGLAELDTVGLIDFGDVGHGLLVAEVAVTAAAAVRTAPGAALEAVVDVVRAFHAQSPLTEAELGAVLPLVWARSAVSALSAARQAALEPANSYVVGDVDRLWAALDDVRAVPPALAGAALRAACGFEPIAGARPLLGRLAASPSAPVVDLDGRRPVPLDLSPASERLTDGAWRTAAGVRDAVRCGDDDVAVGRWGESRLLHGESGATEPATIHLGVDLFVDERSPVRSPIAGTVERRGADELVLRHTSRDGTVLWLRLGGVVPAVEAGVAVEAGDPVGAVAAAEGLLPAHVHVQLALGPMETLPGLGRASLRSAWLALCPDPSALLGLEAAAPAHERADVLATRRRHVGRPQRLYYDDPPEMVRGWRQHLYDADGRAYLDVVNNVAVVGHSHPRITAAASRQLRLLNTNSRFLYDSMGRYASRLVELMPAPLDTVFLVNSGSEANDLALRLARTATERYDVVALRGAYHGWTAATNDLNTSPFYPHAAASHVTGRHLVPAPDRYRGPYGADVPDAGRRYAEFVRQACDAAAEGGAGVAAFICEPQLGNAGGVIAPPGYLHHAYAHVRAAGGLCIADEVQVGFGRLGTSFWGFEQQAAVPDIVTVAKPAGNGFPIGAVVTTRAISERFARHTTLFSSVGGSPVSCEVGIAVLDVIRDERLQQNAATVGEHLRAALGELAGRHEAIGAVHGLGLHQGVDLVADRATRTPAPDVAAAVCERLLDVGIVVRPTGDHDNVLKVKPPLCFEARDADRLVDSLDRLLRRDRRTSSTPPS